MDGAPLAPHHYLAKCEKVGSYKGGIAFRFRVLPPP
jgi:hypothetical protein